MRKRRTHAETVWRAGDFCAGYDFFISDEWSFGVLGRLLYGPYSLGGVGYSTISPAVVATLTYN